MDLKAYAVVFGTVFLAELGDKTQLATVLFASRENINLFGVFIAASLALVFSSALAVGAGSIVSSVIEPRVLSFIAGAGFVIIGVLTIIQAMHQ